MKNTGDYDYQYFRSSRKFQLDPLRTDRLVAEILLRNPQNVLDVGCGLGDVVRRLNKIGVEATGVDNAEVLWKIFWKEHFFKEGDAKKLPFRDNSFDVVFSSDFFEHVPEEDIDTVLGEMKRVGRRILAVIAFEAELTERQAKYHVTNKPREWWIEKLPGVEIL